ncbi:MAG: type II toxin-antitoxin system VapC family toxin [Ardenticatenaceae bacterium]|nr:type II toxin-antitoxin system VapC family toxin [Anaerolineales bacterium]MCB8922269.1 type II toxin-antitoxin system VapC family toxin [Ardenticatenaceae bacterium]MCB8990546.1 type II toxin-antitoxin system VapC family toxin [Ardenticatenaceae bacterium]
MAVVDASVILSGMLPNDPRHEASKAWLIALASSGDCFSAPAILLSEVAAPLSRAYNLPEIAKEVVQTLATAPFAKIVPVSMPLANRAAVIAADYQIRGCDAVYVALAEALGEKLITLDKQQGERARDVVEIFQI